MGSKSRGTWGISVALLVLVASAGLVACTTPADCNGYAALCNRTYDQVAYPTTHNAMSNFEEGWYGANQQYGITRQLEDGVRALMLDTHYNTEPYSAPGVPSDVPMLCHAYCLPGHEPLTSGLSKIRAYLDAHPWVVVTIIFETYITPADTLKSFQDSSLLHYAYEHPVGQPWPTLKTMIEQNKRLVVMTDRDGGTYPWYLPVWSEAFESPFSASTPADLSPNCGPNRGSVNNRLYIFNHFLTDIIGRVELADQVNYNPFLIDRANTCRQHFGRIPNFVTVDFYDRGNVMQAVNALNGV